MFPTESTSPTRDTTLLFDKMAEDMSDVNMSDVARHCEDVAFTCEDGPSFQVGDGNSEMFKNYPLWHDTRHLGVTAQGFFERLGRLISISKGHTRPCMFQANI